MTNEIEILARQTASNLSNLANSYSPRESLAGILDTLLNEHRTLNQTFALDLIVPFVREMAKKFENQNFDRRNQTACEFCHAMWNSLKDRCNLDGNRESSFCNI